MNATLKKIILAASVLAVAGLSVLYLPPVKDFAIALVERLKNDDISDNFWKHQMSAFASCGIIFIAILNLILFTKKGRELFNDFCQAVSKETRFIIANKKYLIFLAAIYLLGYFTIIRGNFCYRTIDDLNRQLEGVREWVNWYRYFDEFGSILLHTSMRLIDIAPLTQLIAVFFVALASFMAVQAATNEKMGYLACLASLPIGLYPYFLSNFSYRYDSPYMALSIFACVLPFVFKSQTRDYIIASVIGLFAMCTSYQASSGIYIVMAVLCAARMRQDGKSWSQIGKFVLASICCYIASLLLFKFIFMEREFKPGAIDERMSLSNVIQNAPKYVAIIWSGLGKSALKIFALLILALNIVAAAFSSKKGRLMNVIVTLAFYALALPLSYGVYMAMGTPQWHSRALYGIGTFFAAASLLLLSLSNNNGKPLRIVSRLAVFAASYCCFAYAFAFGNAQSQQVKQAEFRCALLLEDLSKIMPAQDNGEPSEILVANKIGYAPAVQNLIKVYPLTEICVDIYADDRDSTQLILNSYGFFEFADGKSHNLQKQDLPVLLDTAYHTIQGQDNKFLVTFKEPDLKVIKTRDFY